MTLAPDIELFGTHEAAEYLGMTIENFRWHLIQTRRERSRRPLPEPFFRLRCGQIWTREQLDEWKGEE